MAHEKFGPGPKPVRGTILEMCPLLYQKWSGGYKCPAHSENAILDAMDSFSNEAGDLMEEVYHYMTRKRYMYLLGCMEGEREAQGEKQSSLLLFCFFSCHCFTKFC